MLCPNLTKICFIFNGSLQHLLQNSLKLLLEHEDCPLKMINIYFGKYNADDALDAKDNITWNHYNSLFQDIGWFFNENASHEWMNKGLDWKEIWHEKYGQNEPYDEVKLRSRLPEVNWTWNKTLTIVNKDYAVSNGYLRQDQSEFEVDCVIV